MWYWIKELIVDMAPWLISIVLILIIIGMVFA